MHTFRRWKGTIEPYKTRDSFHVQRLLRHKSIQNTLKYIHFAESIFGSSPNDEWTVKVANTVEEAVKLVEISFVEASDWGNAKIFKKRK